VINANQIQRHRYQLRQASQNPQGVCNTCVRKEATGKYSVRQNAQDFFNHVTADSLIIDVGSDIRCNAACIMCGPHLSTLWQQEHDQKVLFTQATAQNLVEKISTLADLNKVKQFNFVGGEPLLTSTHKEIIRKITDLSDVEFHYNTNGSIFPDEETLDLWSKSKKTDIIFTFVQTPSDENGEYNHSNVENIVNQFFKLSELGFDLTNKIFVIGCTTMPNYSNSVFERLQKIWSDAEGVSNAIKSLGLLAGINMGPIDIIKEQQKIRKPFSPESVADAVGELAGVKTR
jgi:uncharacterized Fe-S cluster-containing radical SAM superfamily protein